MSMMSTQSHLDALNEKHAQLEAELHEAYIHHGSIARIKKEKLAVKDEITKTEKLLHEWEAHQKVAA